MLRETLYSAQLNARNNKIGDKTVLIDYGVLNTVRLNVIKLVTLIPKIIIKIVQVDLFIVLCMKPKFFIIIRERTLFAQGQDENGENNWSHQLTVSHYFSRFLCFYFAIKTITIHTNEYVISRHEQLKYIMG